MPQNAGGVEENGTGVEKMGVISGRLVVCSGIQGYDSPYMVNKITKYSVVDIKDDR